MANESRPCNEGHRIDQREKIVNLFFTVFITVCWKPYIIPCPRQLYLGYGQREYVPMAERDNAESQSANATD